MKIKNIIKATWELPQNALGYIVMKITKATALRSICPECNVYSWKYDNGLSLGKYIFIPYAPTTQIDDSVTKYILHEYGHSIQSRYLGWFYLLVIGLPSLIWCSCCERYRQKHGVSYDSFYTERWANKLGGVDRGE